VSSKRTNWNIPNKLNNMKLKIIRANIKGQDGLKILKPDNKVIDESELENYRQSLKECESDSVLFTFEECIE
jgi:hypothetical protein